MNCGEARSTGTYPAPYSPAVGRKRGLTVGIIVIDEPGRERDPGAARSPGRPEPANRVSRPAPSAAATTCPTPGAERSPSRSTAPIRTAARCRSRSRSTSTPTQPARRWSRSSRSKADPATRPRASRDSYLDLFAPLLDRRDLILIDNRGTGESGAINCAALQSYVGDQVTNVGDVRSAARRHRRRLRLRQRGRGHDRRCSTRCRSTKINLYGDSYGTFFGQTFAVRHPERLRSLILDAAYPIEGGDPWYRDSARAMRQAFRLACARSPMCAARGGDPIKRMNRMAEQLRVTPITGTAADADGIPRTVTIDAAGALVHRVGRVGHPRHLPRARPRDPRRAAATPGQRPAAPARRREPLHRRRRRPRGLLRGPLRRGDLPRLPAALGPDRRSVDPQRAVPGVARPTSTAPTRTRSRRSPRRSGSRSRSTSSTTACAGPRRRSRIHRSRHGTPFPRVPTLVFTGDLDSNTSPEGAAMVARQFGGTLVENVNYTHVSALGDFNRCASRIAQRFVRTLSPGDTSCSKDYNENRLVPHFARRSPRTCSARRTTSRSRAQPLRPRPIRSSAGGASTTYRASACGAGTSRAAATPS